MKMKTQPKHSRKARRAKPHQIEVIFAQDEINECICLIVNAACTARGGIARMTLSDWWEVEAELTQKFAHGLRMHRCRLATSPAQPCRERVMLVGSAMVGPKILPTASSLTPDLVVLDEDFAGVDCAELMRRLKQVPHPPTVFIVSGAGRAESQSRSLAAWADAVLVNAPNLPRQIQMAVKTFFGHAAEKPHRP